VGCPLDELPPALIEETAEELSKTLRQHVLKERQFNIIDKLVLATTKESALIAIDELLRTVLSLSAKGEGWVKKSYLNFIVLSLLSGDRDCEKKGIVHLWGLAAKIMDKLIVGAEAR